MLTDTDIATWRQDGVLVVPQLLNTQDVADLRRVLATDAEAVRH
jgi:hypothetical protein